jgi:hypothetical protein
MKASPSEYISFRLAVRFPSIPPIVLKWASYVGILPWPGSGALVLKESPMKITFVVSYSPISITVMLARASCLQAMYCCGEDVVHVV